MKSQSRWTNIVPFYERSSALCTTVIAPLHNNRAVVEWLKYSSVFHLSTTWTRHSSHWHLYLFRFAIWSTLIEYIYHFVWNARRGTMNFRTIYSFRVLFTSMHRNITWASCKICFLSCNAYTNGVFRSMQSYIYFFAFLRFHVHCVRCVVREHRRELAFMNMELKGIESWGRCKPTRVWRAMLCYAIHCTSDQVSLSHPFYMFLEFVITILHKNDTK